MQIRTVVRERIKGKKPKTTLEKIIVVILYVSESVINTFLPFVSGFYLAVTHQLFWLIPFIFLVVFNLRIEYKNRLIKIKFVRNM